MVINRAVFLDRDGVINKDKGYISTITEFEFCEQSIQGVKMLTAAGYKTIVVTNQSGIGKGYYTESAVKRIHEHLNRELEKQDTYIDTFHYCPHQPDTNCQCRKPRTLLFKKTIREYDIDIRKSFLVGDKDTDIKAGNRIGCETILVKTGHGQEYIGKVDYTAIAENLYCATKYILG